MKFYPDITDNQCVINDYLIGHKKNQKWDILLLETIIKLFGLDLAIL